MTQRFKHRPIRWLHRASGLLIQGQVQARAAADKRGVRERRALQRQRLGQWIFQEPILGWSSNKTNGELFWKALRWGGTGLVIAYWLSST